MLALHVLYRFTRLLDMNNMIIKSHPESTPPSPYSKDILAPELN